MVASGKSGKLKKHKETIGEKQATRRWQVTIQEWLVRKGQDRRKK